MNWGEKYLTDLQFDLVFNTADVDNDNFSQYTFDDYENEILSSGDWDNVNRLNSALSGYNFEDGRQEVYAINYFIQRSDVTADDTTITWTMPQDTEIVGGYLPCIAQMVDGELAINVLSERAASSTQDTNIELTWPLMLEGNEDSTYALILLYAVPQNFIQVNSESYNTELITYTRNVYIDTTFAFEEIQGILEKFGVGQPVLLLENQSTPGQCQFVVNYNMESSTYYIEVFDDFGFGFEEYLYGPNQNNEIDWNINTIQLLNHVLQEDQNCYLTLNTDESTLDYYSWLYISDDVPYNCTTVITSCTIYPIKRTYYSGNTIIFTIAPNRSYMITEDCITVFNNDTHTEETDWTFDETTGIFNMESAPPHDLTLIVNAIKKEIVIDCTDYTTDSITLATWNKYCDAYIKIKFPEKTQDSVQK